MSRWLKFILAILLGAALGLAYGLYLSPVEYVDTAPDTLRPDIKADYVLMVAEVFSSEQNVTLAARRLSILGSEPPDVLAAQALSYAAAQGYAQEDQILLQQLTAALQAGGAQP
jgi:nucleoid-associated protein YgaU